VGLARAWRPLKQSHRTVPDHVLECFALSVVQAVAVERVFGNFVTVIHRVERYVRLEIANEAVDGGLVLEYAFDCLGTPIERGAGSPVD
jgi:hypothetical protein